MPPIPPAPSGASPAGPLDPALAADFDRFTRIAIRALGAPVAQFNVVTDTEQLSVSSLGPGEWRGRRAVGLDASFCRHVVESGRALPVDDARTHPLTRDSRATTESGIGAYLGVPVPLEDGTIAGTLCVVDFAPRAWTEEERALLEDLAASLADRIELARHAAEVTRRAAHAELRRESEARERTQLALERSEARFRSLIEHAPDLISLFDASGTILYQSPSVGRALGEEAYALRGTHFLDGIHPDDVELVQATFAGILAAPASTHGVTCRFRHSDGSWRVLEALGTNLLDDPAVGAVVINARDVTDRVRADEELRRAKFEVVERLAQAAEFRDDDTGQHTRRVGELSARIAAALGLPHDEVELIRLAAPLHDVGKIGVPDGILLKPARLTPDEYETMKRHTRIGAQILRDGTSPLMVTAEVIARAHHERWDGTGYPDRLAGEAIPLPARIVALADFYDALTSDRPYRPAWPHEKVRAEIERGAGTHFDPQVVGAFLGLLGAGGAEWRDDAPVPGHGGDTRRARVA